MVVSLPKRPTPFSITDRQGATEMGVVLTADISRDRVHSTHLRCCFQKNQPRELHHMGKSHRQRCYLVLSMRSTDLNPHHHVQVCKSCHHSKSFHQSCKWNRWPSLWGPRGDQPPRQKPSLQDAGWEEPSTSWEPAVAAARCRQAQDNKGAIRRTSLNVPGIVVLKGLWIK